MSAASHSHTCLSDGRMRSTIDNGPMRACRSSVSSHPSYAAPKRMDGPFCFGGRGAGVVAAHNAVTG
jgi:hypothetical protein